MHMRKQILKGDWEGHQRLTWSRREALDRERGFRRTLLCRNECESQSQEQPVPGFSGTVLLGLKRDRCWSSITFSAPCWGLEMWSRVCILIPLHCRALINSNMLKCIWIFDLTNVLSSEMTFLLLLGNSNFFKHVELGRTFVPHFHF